MILINKNELLDHLKYMSEIKTDQLKEVIDRLPIVEVVRCKDCKWYEQKQKNLPYAVKKSYCNRSCTLATKEDDFCSHGERREE